jgi:hypothetical protein
MIKTQLITDGNSAFFTDSTVEEACERVRRMTHEAVTATRTDLRSRQVVLYVGTLPHSTNESMPRRGSAAATRLGMDTLSLAGVVDRGLRLLHHPAVKAIEFNGDGTGRLVVTDVNGKRFEISVEEIPA